MSIFNKKNSTEVYKAIWKTIIFFLLFFCSSLAVAHAATMSINPSTGSFETGQRISIKVVATSNNVPFNAVSGLLSFPTSIFSIESVSKTNSILNFWVTEPSISQSAGIVKFEGVALGGFSGTSGTIITVNLRVIGVGDGKVLFTSGQILANDGEGTDITGNLIGGQFSAEEAKPEPSKPEVKPTANVQPDILPEDVQPKPTLAAPEISLGARYGEPAILGTSEYPNAQALVTFVALDGTKIFIVGQGDTEGSFSLVIPNSLKHGQYSVTAVMIKPDKTNSDTSNSIKVRVGNFLSDLSPQIFWIFILLILVILYLIFRILHHVTGGTDKNIEREVKQAEEVIHKSFDILREDVSEYGNHKLEVSDHKRIAEIKKDINDAEKVISKEIKDFEA